MFSKNNVNLFKVLRPLITLHTCKMICFLILKKMVIINVNIIVNCDGKRRMTGSCLGTIVSFMYLLFTVVLFWIQILGEERFRCIEKIKTIGYTYMGASGLTPETNYSDMSHVVAMAEFAFSIRDLLQNVNQHSFNNFKMRVGKRENFWSKSLVPPSQCFCKRLAMWH